ncbi:MAG: 4-hydroxythreonine-4-phosphate dehydrogenase PdxA [Gemmatimonadota bacterium]
MRTRLVLTPGDPRGIGPEVALHALDHFRSERPDADVVLWGPEGPLGTDELGSIADSARRTMPPGPVAAAGAFAAASIESAVREASAGRVGGIVTGPLHKPSLHASGRVYPGQTEMLSALADDVTVGMMMAAERTRLDAPLRVLLATTHLPLADVPEAVTRSLLVEQIVLASEALRIDWGISTPTIGLCALNPHASDNGLFGSEEADVLEPAVAEARDRGVTVAGPLPADTVFGRAIAGEFDAVVAPYHDVGMAAFKTVSFGSGVNVTLGLPFVRTSPDHGTAFDIAGIGAADPASMVEAVHLAWSMVNRRFDTPHTDV